MNVTCSAEPCPVILNSSCVFYRGGILLYTGINSGDNLQTSLQKIDAKFQDASIGYIFNNGITQSSTGAPVQLGGKLLQHTTIDNNGYSFGLTQALSASQFKIPSGTNSQFLKADGSLDNTAYGIGNVTNVSVTSGYGISATITNPTTTPTINITNTAPDQTVMLYGGPGITVMGTYPEYTIYNSSGGIITASSPLSITTGEIQNISIAQSSAISDGYLSLTDWNIFNNKLSTLPIATSSILGGVKIGDGVSVSDGTISVSTNYQAPLVSGTNIKTINSNSLLGAGNISITSTTNTNVVADVTVGAVNAGDTIASGTDIQTLVNQIFTKTFDPTFTNPLLSLSNNAGTREIGSTATVRLTFNYNRGAITGKLVAGVWNPSTFQDYRAGTSSSYTINGTTTTNNYVDVSVTFSLSNSYSGSVTYLIGPQPTDSKGANYDVPYPAGTSSTQSTTFAAIYPYYYYKSSSVITASDMQAAIASGAATKVLGDSTGTITIGYNATGEYIAVAYPATSTTKTVWYVSALDNGSIPGGVFGSVILLNCSSSSSYWSGISYKIHVSPGLITQASAIQLRNS